MAEQRNIEVDGIKYSFEKWGAKKTMLMLPKVNPFLKAMSGLTGTEGDEDVLGLLLEGFEGKEERLPLLVVSILDGVIMTKEDGSTLPITELSFDKCFEGNPFGGIGASMAVLGAQLGNF